MPLGRTQRFTPSAVIVAVGVTVALLVVLGSVVRPAFARVEDGERGIAHGLPAPGATPLGIAASSCAPRDEGYRCIYGPVEVPAGESVKILSGMAAPSEAGYITSASGTIVDGDGREIEHHMVHLHHAVWLNPMERDMTCENYDGFLPGYERFFATGKERTRLEMPAGHGYYWSNGVSQSFTGSAPYWVLNAHLDGMHGTDDVYIQLDLGFIPETDPANIVPVKPVWLDVRNCSSDPVFDVPRDSGRGGLHRESWTYRMPRGGRFVAMAGHLHDGGVRLVLHDVTSERRIFTSRARYRVRGEPWNLTGMTGFSELPGRTVTAGDELKLTAVYDSSRPWRDVMGIMLGALVATDG